MKKLDDNVMISPDALADTLNVCHMKLKDVRSRTPGKMELLLRFIFIELHSYLRISLIGCAICILGSIWFPKGAVVLCCSYIGFLGMIMVMELYRRKRYHVEELFGPVYLNSGRVILFKMGGIALLEILEVLIIAIILSLCGNKDMDILLLNGFLPLFLIQLLLLQQSERIQDLYRAASVYIFLFALYNAIVISNNIIVYITVTQLIFIISIIIILFYLRLYVTYQKSMRRTSNGINLTASK